MAQATPKRLQQAAKDLNIGLSTIVDFLAAKGHTIENKPTTKLTSEQVELLSQAFSISKQDKIEAIKSLKPGRLSTKDNSKTKTKVHSTIPFIKTNTSNNVNSTPTTLKKISNIRSSKGIPNTVFKFYGT